MNNALYGLWMPEHERWVEHDGMILHSPFPALLMAYAFNAKVTSWEVLEIGPDGRPALKTVKPKKDANV